MAKSHGIAQMLSALVFCGLLVLAGRHFVSMTLQDNFAQPAEPQPAAQRFGNASLATAKTTPSHIGRSPSGSPLPAASLPPAKSPRAQQLWIMTLPELLNFGRDLALAGDQHSLQQLVGRALIRHITRNPPRTVDNLMALLTNVDEPAALRQTILEALVHTMSALPDNAKADLFYQSLHILQYDNDPALRSAALRAASAFAIALKNSDQPLPATATADLHRLALGYVDAQHEPPELRQTAICELVTTYPSSDFPPKLLAILDSPSQHPAVVVRCAAVALTDLQHPSALPVMSHLLTQTDDQELFFTLAYSIAQFSTKEGLKTLVDNATRHESACQPYIARQQQLIEDIITGADAEYLSTAIKAIPLMPEQSQRLRLMKQAVNAILLGNTPREPESVKALLSVVAEQGTPEECRMLITHIGENQQWQTEWQRVNDRIRAVTGIIVGYRPID